MHHLYSHCMYLVGTNGHMIVGQVSQLAMLCVAVVFGWCNMYVVSFMSSVTSRMECGGCLGMDIWDGWIMFM